MNQGRVARMNVESLWAWLGQCPKNSNGSYLVGVSAPLPLLDTTYLNWGGYATNFDSALFFEAVLTNTGGSRGYATNFGSALFFGAVVVVRTTGGSKYITVV